MTDYNRFISYLFYYSGGMKVSAGHARIEVRQGICKISIHIKKDGIIDSELDAFYYVREAEAGIKRVRLGSISIKDGEGNAVFENDMRDINKSSISFSEVNGVILYLKEYNGYIAADWEEIELSPSQVMYNHDKPMDTTQINKTENVTEENINNNKEIDIESNIESNIEDKTMLDNNLYDNNSKIPTAAGISETKSTTHYQTVSKTMNKKEEMAKNDIVLNKSESDEISLEEDDDESVIINEDTDFDNLLLSEEKKSVSAAEAKIMKDDLISPKIKDENKVEKKSLSTIDSKPAKADMGNKNDMSFNTAASENNYFGKKMPWQDAVEARGILDSNERMYPFQDGEITECVKIEPKDIGRLPVEFWVLGNNSFLLHSYCNYKYLLFAKRMNRVKCEYLLMVPGVYQHREKVMAKMFGFEHFKCIRCREHRIGEFGYWYMSITF